MSFASAHTAALDTVPMIARRGRASFLGKRSQGHMDPRRNRSTTERAPLNN
jgi:hypothetical protein